MTANEFLNLSDDGVERWLIRGELREKRNTDMTMRNKAHSITQARLTGFLGAWLDQLPQPRGEVVCGDVGFIFRGDPSVSIAGVDVALINAEQADADEINSRLFLGPPLFLGEVLSPYDTTEEVAERVEEYLEGGVRVVWVINPYSRTVIVHRPGESALALDTRDALAGDPELPGFSCPVAALFR